MRTAHTFVHQNVLVWTLPSAWKIGVTFPLSFNESDCKCQGLDFGKLLGVPGSLLYSLSLRSSVRFPHDAERGSLPTPKAALRPARPEAAAVMDAPYVSTDFIHEGTVPSRS